jgi:hypothetical protein
MTRLPTIVRVALACYLDARRRARPDHDRMCPFRVRRGRLSGPTGTVIAGQAEGAGFEPTVTLPPRWVFTTVCGLRSVIAATCVVGAWGGSSGKIIPRISRARPATSQFVASHALRCERVTCVGCAPKPSRGASHSLSGHLRPLTPSACAGRIRLSARGGPWRRRPS